MISGRFQDTKFRQSLTWLFYAGLLLVLLGEPQMMATELAPGLFVQLRILVRTLGMGLLFLRILTLLFTHPRETLVWIAVLVTLRFSFVLADPVSPKLYRLAVVVAASRGSDSRMTMRLFLAYLAFFLVAFPFSWMMGWADSLVKHIGRLQGGSYGFKNPNGLAAFLAIATLLGIYLRKQRRVAAVFAFCWSAAALTFLITFSRTQALLLAVMPLLWLLFRKYPPKPWLLALLPFACLAASILLAAHFDPGYGSNTFESRFSIPALVYQKCGLSLFGRNCGLSGWFRGVYPYQLAIDNAYLALFLCRGALIGLTVLFFLARLLYLIGKKGDGWLTAVACCMTVLGMMESIPLVLMYAFLPLFYLPLVEEYAPGGRKAELPVSIALALSFILFMFMPWHPDRVRPHPFGTVADIPCPPGFQRQGAGPDSFSAYLEQLPLARPDSVLAGFTETPSDTQVRGCYRVVDLPLIDEYEQCADVCMRLRAEYLYRDNRFRKIRFVDTQGKTLQYRYGACRPLFDRYLKAVFAWCNTESLRLSLLQPSLDELVPGDIFVFEKDARPEAKYGHAVIVAAMAVDTLTAQKAVLLIQGSTPACDIHVVANLERPDLSPWFLLQEPADTSSAPVVTVGSASFFGEDIRRF